MRLVLMATGPFAAPTFEALAASRHDVVALVTKQLGDVRKRYEGASSPLRPLAERFGTPVFDPENVNTDEARRQLAEYSADLLVVCDYGKILSAATLATARLGGINLHGSLLPKYRGAAPVAWAIYHGETETGVSVIHMTPQLDAGPCIAQARTAIGAEETAGELEHRLSQLGAPLVLEAIEALEAGGATAIPQEGSRATRAPRLKKEDGAVDWSRFAAAIANQVRAMSPWPRAFTFWHPAEGPPVRLILDRASPLDVPVSGVDPGTIVTATADRLEVATGDGQLAILRLQPAGKRAMTTQEFMHGHGVAVGQRLGPSEAVR
ncbi:MAG: methionyl-tRNA formyltransferase [Pirellulales bacterium]